MTIDSKAKGRAKGGFKRAEILSPQERREIAKKAAFARWKDKPLLAKHKGNFEKDFGIDVECYVLDDPNRTAVLSQTGMARVLGLFPTGKSLPRFLTSKAMMESGGADFGEIIENPIKFQWGTGGAEAPPTIINGYDAALLIDICRAIVAAAEKGKLAKRHERVVQQANIILGASAKSGIKHLVYALAGYSPTTEEVIAAFKLYVLEEAKRYEPEFPNELYVQWHRLYEIPVLVRGKPWHFKHLTVRHIYHPLAKSSGKLLKLLRALKASEGDRQTKLFHFLNEVGARALRIHLGRVLEMAESSANRATYEKKVNERFGDQPELDLVMPSSPSASPLPS